MLVSDGYLSSGWMPSDNWIVIISLLHLVSAAISEDDILIACSYISKDDLVLAAIINRIDECITTWTELIRGLGKPLFVSKI